MNNELEKKFSKLNNIIGWLVFLVAIVVYYSTVESTASFWDCSENLSVYYKLEVGHSPGEPFLQLIQHLVSLLSFGNVHNVAPLINHAASTLSAFAILFLFWTITYFARKLLEKNGGLNANNMYAVLGCGIVGAGAFIFADSMWFSANEASVWAGACSFAAFMFWCMTKWERSKDRPENWMIFVFYFIGLSIGVHLLSLLFIPSAVFIYYYKNHPDGIKNKWANSLLKPFTKSPKTQGIIVAGIASVLILGGIKNGVIPWIVDLGFRFELFFVNVAGMPFNSGIIIYALALLAFIIWGIRYTKKHNKPGWNMAVLSFAVLLIGYSSYMLIVVRAAAQPPLNEGNPSNPISLHSYLGREQYGDWPLLYGPYWNAPQTGAKTVGTLYAKDEKQKKYVVTSSIEVPTYDPRFCTVFPRMWEDAENYPDGYKSWGGTDVEKLPVDEGDGNTKMVGKPTFADNLHFFFSYQVYFMYIRYFMWEFCGRQNDFQGMDPPDVLHGNWITGIPFIDAMIGPPQDNMPPELSKNKARTPMYALPLLLGLLGSIYQYRKDRGAWLTVGVFFFFAGLAIVLYLNQHPYQPRERFYSYVISFYAFAIWIGMGVLGLYALISNRILKGQVSPKAAAFAATAIGLVVPVVMCRAELPSHNRNGHYVTRATAINYLESCAPNAILFTNGDNDTFPLWYAQEVEGIRTDVRVCNLELLGMAWYVDMMNRKQYKSDRLPFSLTHEQYKDGVRDYLQVYDRGLKGYTDLNEIIDFIKSDDRNDQLQLMDGRTVNYFPTRRLELKVNKQNVIESGAIPASLQDSIPAVIDFNMPGSIISRSEYMVLDCIAHNNWKRPIYFAVSLPMSSYLGLDQYMQLEGMAYRLVPIKGGSVRYMEGMRINTSLMYDNMMNKFNWGNMSKGIYMDAVFRSTIGGDLKVQGALLSQALIRENKKDSAIKILNLVTDSIPVTTCPNDYYTFMIVNDYYQAGDTARANPLASELFNDFDYKLKYYHTLDQNAQNYYSRDMESMQDILERLAYFAQHYNQTKLGKDFSSKLEILQKSGILQPMQQGQ